MKDASQNEISGYYENDRADVRAIIHGQFERCLDVGCGAGVVSSALKTSGIIRVAHGIELNPKAAAEAKRRLDEVICQNLEEGTGKLENNYYDLVLCLDVLEHLQDPWKALTNIKRLMKPEATLIVSLPNVRNFRVVLPLVLKGEWDYTDSGLLDITHLRFFTRKTALELVARSGFQIVSIDSTSRKKFSKSWWVDLFSLGIFREFLDFQYVITAKPGNDPTKNP